MKRIFTLLVAMVAIATTASAQFQFGVEAGLNIQEPSSFSESALKSYVNPDNSLGWFAGLKVKRQFVSGLGVDGAILFNQMKNDMGESSKQLRYIVVPINLRFQIGLGPVAAIYAAAGPQWGVNIGDRDWSVNDIQNVGSLYKPYYKSAKQNLSVNLGAGVMIMKHIQVGFTYNIPITKNGEALYNVPNNLSDIDEMKSNWRNNSWQIRAAYFF